MQNIIELEQLQYCA